MNKLFTLLILLITGGALHAAGQTLHLDKANVNINDAAALQRGAKYFTHYCLNCHSMKYERWQRMTNFGLTKDQIKDYLMPPSAKIANLMTIAMDPGDASKWFGGPAPDLTLEARLRGTDWVYTYLRSFYLDESRPFGVNNSVFDKVSMPHVLWEYQGFKKPIYRYDIESNGQVIASFKTIEDAAKHAEAHQDAKVKEVVDSLVMSQPGKVTEVEYDNMVRDIVTFLAYMAEPVQHTRKKVGLYVLLFLGLFFVLTYFLKKEYWKDIKK